MTEKSFKTMVKDKTSKAASKYLEGEKLKQTKIAFIKNQKSKIILLMEIAIKKWQK